MTRLEDYIVIYGEAEEFANQLLERRKKQNPAELKLHSNKLILQDKKCRLCLRRFIYTCRREIAANTIKITNVHPGIVKFKKRQVPLPQLLVP